MKYSSEGSNASGDNVRTGILLTNLGTPEAPTRKALRVYLREFLADPRVVEAPRWLWWCILNLIILNTRPGKSAALYKKIWQPEGSPLFLFTRQQSDALCTHFDDEKYIVDFAMRYGQPSIDSRLKKLRESGANKIVLLPLYPQYSGATTGSTFDAVSLSLQNLRWVPELHFISDYHDHPAYIQACANQIKKHWQSNGRPEKLLLSFHGTPESYRDNGDPYYQHCQKTTELIARELQLADEDFVMCFQSRFGRQEWIKPYTDKTLATLAAEGVQNVQVFCPGFSADCLETLEEVALQLRDEFLSVGGSSFQYIPALNDSEEHIAALRQIITDSINPPAF